MSDLVRAKDELSLGAHTCVLCQGAEIRASDCRGVKPLVDFYRSGENFCGWSAADKVVGKATAYLYVLLEIKNLYAAVVSRKAIQVLTEAGIYVEYGEMVDHIINRRGDGMCPFEEAVSDAKTPTDAYAIIIEKMQQMNIT